MKISCNFSAQVLATNYNVSKDDRRYYNATIFVPETGEAGSINISEDLYKDLISGSTYDFKAEYNDKYNNFRVVGINE